MIKTKIQDVAFIPPLKGVGIPATFVINHYVYKFKMKAIKALIQYYLRNGLDVSTDPNGGVVLFRDPMTGNRQITFHLGKKGIPAQNMVKDIENHEGTWDGVTQAHHYTDDESYNKAREARKKKMA